MLASTRAFFAARDVMEVETPALSDAAVTSSAIGSLGVHTPRGSFAGYLHTSPEFPMKRLLAAGAGSIYQICRVFRADEQGRRHNPEFTLLEWYRVGFDHRALMAEVAELVTMLLPAGRLSRPYQVLAYRAAFRSRLGIDPLHSTTEELRAVARSAGIDLARDLGDQRDAWLDLLLSHAVQPELGRGRLTFLEAFPASQAALAQLDPNDPRVARRFELYLDGVELANGFRELTDADTLRARFERELAERAAAGLPPVPMDQRFLAAVESGCFPQCSGVALGFDRLLMLSLGAESLDQVMAFSSIRA
jgi:lysyl-tRNA synthetase class 2